MIQTAQTATIDPPPSRTVPRAAVGVGFLAAIAALAVHHLLEPFNASSHMGLFTNGGDLDIYRRGALQILHGQRIYHDQLPAGGWFTYPPFAAITFVPLAVLNFTTAKALWMALSFTALAATIWRCATVLGYRPDRRLMLISVALTFVALDIQAVRGTLWQGQINLILMAIIVWDLTRPNGARMHGWAAGIAAGIKLTAIVFVPYLLVTRQWRIAATAMATAVATVAVTWIVLPADSTDYWLHAVFQTDRIGPLAHPGNYSIGGILATIWEPTPMPALLWLAAVGLASLLGLYAAYQAHRTGNRLLAITITGMLSCTMPPLAWSHHWVWSVPLLAVILDRAARATGTARWRWAASTAAVYLTVFMWFNAWLYRTAHSLNNQYPTYVDALDAAIDQMTKADRLLAVATQPALFIAVAVATIAGARWLSSRPADRPH